MSLFLAFLLVAVSIAIISYGANFFTDGASSIARKLKLSPLIIGLTVVAFGTSAPELAVSLTSAFMGKAGISLGNVIGSNLFNILVVLGLAAVFCPLRIGVSTKRFELPFLLVASVLILFLAKDSLFFSSKQDVINQLEGFILLALFVLFVYYVVRLARRKKRSEEDAEHPIREYNWAISIGLLLLGLVMLVGGSSLFTKSAVVIAKAFHVSDAVIGITLVAMGTSIPELATSLVAALKKQVDLAVGNVVGSNIFNTLLIPGAVALLNPIDASQVSVVDFSAPILSVVLLLAFTYSGGKKPRLTYWHGAFFLLLYVGYMLYLIYGSV